MELFGRIRLFRREQEERLQQRRSPLASEKSSVARQLFGTPDHEENMKFVREELAKNQREACERWNFDFANEKPIPGGRFVWEYPGNNEVVAEQQRAPLEGPENGSTKREEKAEGRDRLEGGGGSSDPDQQRQQLAAMSDKPLCSSDPNDPAAVAAVDSCSSTTTPTTVSREPSSRGKPSDCDNASLSSSSTSNSTSQTSEPTKRPRQRQSQITGHFTQRKRSKSKPKIKTQERKECDEYEASFTQPT